MPTVENVPGRHDTAPPGHDATLEQPARARGHLSGRRLAGDEQPPPPRIGRLSSTALRGLWILALVALALGLAATRTIETPKLVQQSMAAALGVVLAIGLAVRSGGQAPLAAAVAACLGGAAVATQWAPLLAGAAVATGVVAACLAVLATRPAVKFPAVALEVVLALLLATAGALAVAGFAVDLDVERLAYTVVLLSLAAALALVNRLGGGLHTLGRRGVLLAAGATVLLVVVLVYTAALTRYGSPELVMQVRSAEGWAQDHLGGVPRPVEMLVGIPALAWGVSMRTRRRQGWWVCAFGATATAAATSRLVVQRVDELSTALSVGYSIVGGLLLGYVVIRLERLLTGRGSRAEQAQVHREEPGRMQPLH